MKTIFQQVGPGGGNNHGCRIAQAPDGNLFVTLGDHFGPRDEAQNLANDNGKIVRIGPDGSVPQDNPFVGRASVRPEIWSYGHRNPQGLTFHPPPASCGSTSTARAAATRSTSSRRARTTAGR